MHGLGLRIWVQQAESYLGVPRNENRQVWGGGTEVSICHSLGPQSADAPVSRSSSCVIYSSWGGWLGPLDPTQRVVRP